METPRPRNYIQQKYQEIRSLLPPISTLLLLFSTEIMGRVLPLSTGRPNTYLSIHLSLDGCRTWKFELPVRFRFDFGEGRSFISVRVHMRDDTCTTWPLFVASNWDELDLHGVFFLVSDGNAAGTGPGDPWTGGSGGVQPPYSGYAPPHLAQPAYPMHLPHDPMVRPPSLVPFLPPSLRFASISPSPFSFRLIRPSLITRPPPFVANSSPLPDCC